MKHYRIFKTKEGFQLEMAKSYFGVMGVWYLLANKEYVCEAFSSVDELISKHHKRLKGHFIPIVEAIFVK